MRIILLIFLLWMVSLPAVVLAERGRGLGAFIGTSDHSYTALQKDGTEYQYSSAGNAVQIDYRAPMQEFFTVGVFFILAMEEAKEEVVSATPMDAVSIFQLGAEARIWWKELFLGGQYSSLSQALYTMNDPVPVNAGGSGLSVIAGWESEKGWSLMFQVISGFMVDDFETEITMRGYRAMLGYRWDDGSSK